MNNILLPTIHKGAAAHILGLIDFNNYVKLAALWRELAPPKRPVWTTGSSIAEHEDVCCLFPFNYKVSTLSVIPSIFCYLSRSGLWGQQSKHRCPGHRLPSHLLQLLQLRHSQASLERSNFSSIAQVCPRASSRLKNAKQTHLEGIIVRCLNHLRSSGCTVSPS